MGNHSPKHKRFVQGHLLDCGQVKDKNLRLCYPKAVLLPPKSHRFLTLCAQNREAAPTGWSPGREERRKQQGSVPLLPATVGSLRPGRGWVAGAPGLAALTCLGPRGGWCGLGTRTQRPPAGRGCKLGPARPARGPRASSSAGTWQRCSPWPWCVGRPGPRHRARSVRGRRRGCAEARRAQGLQVRGGCAPEEPDSRCGRATRRGSAERAE